MKKQIDINELLDQIQACEEDGKTHIVMLISEIKAILSIVEYLSRKNKEKHQ